MTVLAWSQLVLTVVAIGVAAGSLGFALVSRPAFRHLRSVTPSTRFALLAALAVLPAALGLMTLSIAFAPSLFDAMGWVRDHCAYHPGHDFHLCFVHGTPPAVSPGVVGVGIAILLWLGSACIAELSPAVRAARWARQLGRLSDYDDASGSHTFDSDHNFAFSIGLLHPRVFVSSGLREDLSQRQLEAVLAHEEAHVRRRDALTKTIVRLFARLHLPGVRGRLVEELDLASEQACDESAAAEVKDRLVVAETILAMERSAALPVAALGFGTAVVEERVRGMLDDDWKSVTWVVPGIAAALVAGALAEYYDSLHHLAETFLSPLF